MNNERREVVNEIDIGEIVSRVHDDIKSKYENGKRGIIDARLDLLRLSTARMLEGHTNEGVVSVTHEMAEIATRNALVGDWEPMMDFISHEILGVELFAGSGGVSWLENLRSSLQE